MEFEKIAGVARFSATPPRAAPPRAAAARGCCAKPTSARCAEPARANGGATGAIGLPTRAIGSTMGANGSTVRAMGRAAGAIGLPMRAVGGPMGAIGLTARAAAIGATILLAACETQPKARDGGVGVQSDTITVKSNWGCSLGSFDGAEPTTSPEFVKLASVPGVHWCKAHPKGDTAPAEITGLTDNPAQGWSAETPGGGECVSGPPSMHDRATKAANGVIDWKGLALQKAAYFKTTCPATTTQPLVIRLVLHTVEKQPTDSYRTNVHLRWADAKTTSVGALEDLWDGGPTSQQLKQAYYAWILISIPPSFWGNHADGTPRDLSELERIELVANETPNNTQLSAFGYSPAADPNNTKE